MANEAQDEEKALFPVLSPFSQSKQLLPSGAVGSCAGYATLKSPATSTVVGTSATRRSILVLPTLFETGV